MKEKILIVDDESAIRGMLDYVLSEEGYDVKNASNGDEALSLLHSEPFDLVMTDLKMPVMDGLTLLRKVKELDESIEVIILTGYASVQNAVAAMKEGGAFDFLEKPLEEIELVGAVVARALEKRRLKLRNKELNRELLQAHQDLESRYEKLKQAEKEVRLAKEEAERASRAKGRFLARVSHGFRTPLNAVLGFSQFMEKDLSLSPKQLENIDIINRSGNELLDLTEKVVDNSRFETGKVSLVKKVYDLHALLEETRNEADGQASARNLQFSCRIDPDVPRFVKIDGRRLKNILKELIDNAVDYTEKGEVALTAGAAGQTPLQLFFEVQDTGPGISPHEEEIIFEAYMQGECGAGSGRGAGLGLTLGRSAARLMGGDLTVKSKEGGGAVFRLEIQSDDVGAAIPEKVKDARKIIGLEPGQPEYRILVVDDIPINRLIVKEMLRRLGGFQIIEAVDGREAVELFGLWQPHLIWMDIKMPVMDGFEATKEIRGLTGGKDVRIIFLSASSFEDERESLLKAGGDDFMQKPFKMESLYEMMGKHIGVRFSHEE